MAERLTPHQRGFLIPITRQYRGNVDTGLVDPRLHSKYVGSPSTCDHLVRKGWLTRETVYGPRGGRSYLYTPTVDALALLERVDAPYRGAQRVIDEYFKRHHEVDRASNYAYVEGYRPGYKGNEFHEIPRSAVLNPAGLRHSESLGYTVFAVKVRSVRYGVDVTADFSIGELKRAAEEAA